MYVAIFNLYRILFFDSSRGLGTGDYQQMPRLILSQFRWLNQIVDGKVRMKFTSLIIVFVILPTLGVV